MSKPSIDVEYIGIRPKREIRTSLWCMLSFASRTTTAVSGRVGGCSQIITGGFVLLWAQCLRLRKIVKKLGVPVNIFMDESMASSCQVIYLQCMSFISNQASEVPYKNPEHLDLAFRRNRLQDSRVGNLFSALKNHFPILFHKTTAFLKGSAVKWWWRNG